MLLKCRNIEKEKRGQKRHCHNFGVKIRRSFVNLLINSNLWWGCFVLSAFGADPYGKEMSVTFGLIQK